MCYHHNHDNRDENNSQHKHDNNNNQHDDDNDNDKQKHSDDNMDPEKVNSQNYDANGQPDNDNNQHEHHDDDWQGHNAWWHEHRRSEHLLWNYMNEDKITKLIHDDDNNCEHLPHVYKKYTMLLHKRNARNEVHKS